jgi:arylsulfatase A-like enzyme
MAKPEATYAAMISAIDKGVGDILQALEETKQRDNTLIIHISDNGGTPRGSNLPLRGGKGSIWEGGIRVLALANWTGKIRPGTEVDILCSYIDVVPTLCAVAGLDHRPAEAWDGCNVMPQWQERSANTPLRPFFSFYETYKAPGERLSVIEGDWKLFREGNPILDQERPSQNATVNLFHLAKDISESENLAAEYPDRVERMLNQLVRFRKLRPPVGGPPQPGPMPKGWKPPNNWEPDSPIERQRRFGESTKRVMATVSTVMTANSRTGRKRIP